MADYRARATFYAQKYGIDPLIFGRQISQESGFNPKARSPAGALGIAQIVPKWHPGVDPMDPEAALDYAAKWMSGLVKQYGNYKDALSVYNSGKPWKIGQTYGETSHYVGKILDGPKAGAKAAPQLPSTPAGTDLTPSANLTPQMDPRLASAQGGLQALATGNYNPNQALSDLFELDAQAAAMPPPEAGRDHAAHGAPAGASAVGKGDWSKWVGKIETRSGPSAAHGQGILRFVGQVGRQAGTVLTPWGNESHSLTTTSGTPSAHGAGNAADIPAAGKELVRLGRAALIAAGMPPAQANKQTGGLFNVGGYQVIFNTQIGGNHADHLHVGLRK